MSQKMPPQVPQGSDFQGSNLNTKPLTVSAVNKASLDSLTGGNLYPI